MTKGSQHGKDLTQSRFGSVVATFSSSVPATRACVTIVRPFDSTEILRSIVMQLDPQGSGNLDADSIASKTTGLLDGKKYLIVLDDLSSTAEWDAIIQHLPTLETASRIIVTTRLENIARHCSKR
ncbi:hypothetical protein EJB05_19302, partial [Eragrostis curvula]